MIAQWATARGWSYAQRDDRWAHCWPDHPFDSGYGQRAQNVVSGAYGPYTATAFDFSYKQSSGSGKSRRTTTYRFGVVALGVPVPLPWVHVEPEGLFDKAAKLFGGQDIELESEDFNRVYRVRSDDPKFAYDLLNARTMEVLLAAGGVDVRVSRYHLVTVRQGQLDLTAVEAWLGLLVGLCERLPSFVWTDRGSAAPPPLAPGMPA